MILSIEEILTSLITIYRKKVACKGGLIIDSSTYCQLLITTCPLKGQKKAPTSTLTRETGTSVAFATFGIASNLARSAAE